MKLEELLEVLTKAKPFPLRAEDVFLPEVTYCYNYSPKFFVDTYPSLPEQIGAKSMDEIYDECRTLFDFKVFDIGTIEVVNLINDNEYSVFNKSEILEGWYDAVCLKSMHPQCIGGKTNLPPEAKMFSVKKK